MSVNYQRLYAYLVGKIDDALKGTISILVSSISFDTSIKVFGLV